MTSPGSRRCSGSSARAVRKDIPVLGHCLGGQLLSKALGGSVRANPYKEIGWGEVRVCDNGIAREWLGELQAFDGFQWHGETFSIPPGATRVLENAHCANQAFAIGKHFAMQCHVEMTEELIRAWVQGGADEIKAAAVSPRCRSPKRWSETWSAAAAPARGGGPDLRQVEPRKGTSP